MRPRDLRQHHEAVPPVSHRRRRARRRTSVAVTVLLAVALGGLGGYGLGLAAQITWESAASRPAAADPQVGLLPPTQHPKSTRHTSPTTAAPGPPTVAPTVPAAGTGRFVAAPGTGGRIGDRGTLVRFRVVVEIVDQLAAGGSGPLTDPAVFARAVERTLADGRSWTSGGDWSFQRVAGDDPADLIVHLTTPQTTDLLCGQYGLDTAGEVSCRGGGDVMINFKRWQLAVPWYADAIDDYRHMVTNHEIGHFLGHGHSTCAGPGRPAAVMQTQTYGLEGCARNPWPYPDGANYLG